jgi:hypothetical protein
MKRNQHRSTRWIMIAFAATLGLGVVACDPGGESTGSSDLTALADQPAASAGPSSTLSAADAAAIVYMREEEKLARDVYAVLGEQWDVAIFDNIASSEQQHMDAVATLLDRYDLADPAATTAPGEFTDSDLQTLYDQLVEQGSRSLVDALTVGATIEDLDIADLRSMATSAVDVQAVWNNLERGSRNHLRAFSGQLDRLGETYEPQYISQTDYDAIVTSGTEAGRGS